LRPGELLDIGTPGRFHTAISADREHSYVAFAAGSASPGLSLATDILAREPAAALR
jgi:hypothetical protein